MPERRPGTKRGISRCLMRLMQGICVTYRSDIVFPGASQVNVGAGSRVDRALWAFTGLMRRHWVLGCCSRADWCYGWLPRWAMSPRCCSSTPRSTFSGPTSPAPTGIVRSARYTLFVLRPLLMVATWPCRLAAARARDGDGDRALCADAAPGVTRWLAALAVAPVLLDAYQLNAEQTIMPDVLFEVLLVAGIVLLLWQPRPGLAFVILGGLALGASAPVRQVGEALILPA